MSIVENNMEASFRQYLKPFGEKALQDFREQSIKQGADIISKRNTQMKNEDNFKMQLVTLSGGVISIFIAFQNGAVVSALTIGGYALLGISLVFGIISIYFSLRSKYYSISMQEESNLLQQQSSLKTLESFYHLDVTHDKWVLSQHEKIVKDLKDEYDKRELRWNKILKAVHLDYQKVEDLQLILFVVGVIILILGLLALPINSMLKPTQKVTTTTTEIPIQKASNQGNVVSPKNIPTPTNHLEPINPQSVGTPRLILVDGEKRQHINDNEYFTLLKEQIESEGISASEWFQNRCNEFWIAEEENGKYISIERHGYHQDGCPGDPNSSPRYNRFLIDIRTKEIFYDNYVIPRVIPFAEWINTINLETK